MDTSPSFFLRSVDGKAVAIPSHFKFIELRSSDGLVALVLGVEGDRIVMFDSNGPEASRYQGNFSDVRFCDNIKIPSI